jgi:Fe-coproporphyrin III synthase
MGLKLNRLFYLSKYYFLSKFTDKKNPILGGIKLTHSCNLQCRQCPYWQRPRESLTYTQVLNLMDEMYQQGVRLLIFEGGEPMLWHSEGYKLEDLIVQAKKRFYSVGVTTNGTVPLDCSADIVWVSIDGLKETHDYLRSNSYDLVMENLRVAKHPNIYTNITFNKLNCKEVTELVHEVSPLAKGITIQFFFPYSESDNSLLLTWDERKKVLEDLMTLKRLGFPIADSFSALKALINNNWRCNPWMLANADPNGQLNHGCYLLKRTDTSNPCKYCGFAAHTEASLAYNLDLEAIWVGRKIFKLF